MGEGLEDGGWRRGDINLKSAKHHSSASNEVEVPMVETPSAAEAPAEAALPEGTYPEGTYPEGAARKPLSPAALRALEEAALRRAEARAVAAETESGGPKGLEPTRFGDWERKGLAVDF